MSRFIAFALLLLVQEAPVIRAWGGLKTLGALNLGTYGEILFQFIFKSDTKFTKLSAYTNSSGVALKKTYYLSQVFQADWVGAYNLCKDSEMELLSLADAAEMTAFNNFAAASLSKFRPFTQIFIGGIATALSSRTAWNWFDSGVKLTTGIIWAVGQPDNSKGNEYCLGLVQVAKKFNVADFSCYGLYDLFVCQDVQAA